MIKKSVYSINKVSSDAVVACVMAGCSFLCIMSAIIISFLYDGKGPIWVGVFGIAAVMFSLTGVVFTVNAWKSEDGGLLMKKFAGIVNTIPFVCEIILYFIGWF